MGSCYINVHRGLCVFKLCHKWSKSYYFWTPLKIRWCFLCFLPPKQVLYIFSCLKPYIYIYITGAPNANFGKCQRHVALKNVSAIPPFVYRCQWIQKLSKRAIKWANRDGTPPLSQSPIVAPEKSFSSSDENHFPHLQKRKKEKKWLSPLQSFSVQISNQLHRRHGTEFAAGHCCTSCFILVNQIFFFKFYSRSGSPPNLWSSLSCLCEQKVGHGLMFWLRQTVRNSMPGGEDINLQLFNHVRFLPDFFFSLTTKTLLWKHVPINVSESNKNFGCFPRNFSFMCKTCRMKCVRV